MGKLIGTAAIVTGGARGIGRAIATRFLEEGAQVLICDILEDRLRETVGELSELGEVHGHPGDLSRKDVCAAAVHRAVDLFGGVHIVVNNAGIARWAPFLDHSEEDWDRTFDVNLKAVFLLSQQAARVMVEQGKGGVILSMASNNGHVPEPEVAAYNASKGGVVLLTKTMAIELAKHNIRANSIAPGHIGPTDLSLEGGADETFCQTLADGIPLGRLGKLEEVAALYAFLASDEAQFINGHSIIIDGGQTAGQ